jgi:hypothetical protein
MKFSCRKQSAGTTADLLSFHQNVKRLPTIHKRHSSGRRYHDYCFYESVYQFEELQYKGSFEGWIKLWLMNVFLLSS